MRENWFLRTLLLGTMVLLLTACSAGDGDDSDDGGDSEINEGSLSTANKSATTGSDGSAEVTFEVPNGTTKFSVSADSESRSVRLDTLEDEDGTNFLDPGGEFISFATEFVGFINNATAPSRDFDPEVNSSKEFRVRATAGQGSFSSPVEGADMHFRIDSRVDSDLLSGSLRINLFFVGTFAQSSASRAAVATGLDEFRRIYRDNAGISLTVNDQSIAGPESLPDPFAGSSFYLSASSSQPSPAVNLFIGGDVSSVIGDVLGVAGGIPGPPNPSARSAVVVNMLTSAGPDGVFDSEELRVLGETMAHECGHFLGLFHPVDFSGSGVSGTDPLPDTATCNNFDDCTSTRKSLINNLMFAFPVAGEDGSLVPQNVLSAQQRGVMNRYIAVD